MCIAIVVAAGGCAPESLQRAVLDDVCGQPSPYRVLELEDDRDSVVEHSKPARVGDHIVLGSSTVYAFAPCDESPRIVAHDVKSVTEREPFPGLALGCDTNRLGEVVLVDPTGVEAQRTVFTAPGCNGKWGKHGIVGVVPNGGTENMLVIQPYPPDFDGPPVEPVPLLDPIQGWSDGDVAVRDDELFVIDLAGDLMNVELPGGEVELEQPDVSIFAVSSNARFLAFMDDTGVLDHDALAQAHGDLVIRDRITGTEIVVDDASMSWPLVLDVDGFAWFWLGSQYRESMRVVDLATMALYAIPEDRELWIATVGGRWVTSSSPGHLQLRDVATGEEMSLPPFDVRWTPGFWYFDDHGVEVIDGVKANGPLRRLSFDGSAPEVLAHRVRYGYRKLVDQRVVTRVDILGQDTRGDLVVVEPESLVEQVVDEDVASEIVLDPELGFGEDVVLYGVHDGDRSGVWAAAIAP